MAKPKEQKKHKDSDSSCCCDFQVLAHGTSRSVVTALREAVDLNLSIDTSVGADASAIGANPPNPPASSSDADGENKIVNRQLQGPDRIGKVDEYTVVWDVMNSRLPAMIELELSGNVRAHMRCAGQSGSATFADFNVRKQSDTDKGETKVVVTARNACNEYDRCEFTIREP